MTMMNVTKTMMMAMMIYIYNDRLYLCLSVSDEKVITSWIVDDDDIYMLPKLDQLLLCSPALHFPLSNDINCKLIITIMNVYCPDDND